MTLIDIGGDVVVVDDLNVWWLGSGMQGSCDGMCNGHEKYDSICLAMCYNNVWRPPNVKEATKESSMLGCDSERVDRNKPLSTCQSERVILSVSI